MVFIGCIYFQTHFQYSIMISGHKDNLTHPSLKFAFTSLFPLHTLYIIHHVVFSTGLPIISP